MSLILTKLEILQERNTEFKAMDKVKNATGAEEQQPNNRTTVGSFDRLRPRGSEVVHNSSSSNNTNSSNSNSNSNSKKWRREYHRLKGLVPALGDRDAEELTKVNLNIFLELCHLPYFYYYIKMLIRLR